MAEQRSNAIVRLLYALKRRMYPGNRPGRLARAMIRSDAAQFSAGLLSPRRAVTLEVRGRRTGRAIRVPVVVADHEGGRFLVAMLGDEANWVRNVRAAGGHAVVCRGRRTPVLLTEVAVEDRPPILRRYLDLAPGARPHLPVSRHASLDDFAAIAGGYPVFRITDARPVLRPNEGSRTG